MKKTINVSLAGLSFVIDEDAYALLESYMKSVRNYFASYKEADEIANDIEARFAEQFSEKAGTSSVVALPEVEAVISSMGKPEEFEGTEPRREKKEKESSATRRLYRDNQNMILGGVAGGIAAYLGCDSVWVRLLFAISVLFGGFGIFLYAILWIVLPEAKTETERMQMRGEPVTLKGFEEMLKNRSKIGEAARKPLGMLASFFRASGKVIKIFFICLMKLIGWSVVISALAAVAGFLLAVTTLAVNGDSPYIDFPLQGLAHDVSYYAALFSGSLIVVIPLIFLGLLGASMAAGRFAFKRMIGFSLTVVWIAAAIVFANAAISIAPQVETALKTDSAFQISSSAIPISDFNKIRLGGADTAEIFASSSFSVAVEGREQDIRNSDIHVDQGVFRVKHSKERLVCLFCFRKPLHFTIYAPAIEAIEESGAASVVMEGFSAAKFEAELSGASNLTFAGSADSAVFDLSGASQIDAGKAEIGDVMAWLSGASDIYLGNVNDLTVEASGASNVYYNSAKTIHEELSGASDMKPNWTPEPDYPEKN